MSKENKTGSVADPRQLASLIEPIAQIIEAARSEVRYAVNQAMVQSYWQIGQIIVEQEQQGQERAEYGTQQLKQLSAALTDRLGKGFDITNLRNMRRFYLAFPIRDAVRPELSWTHYRALIRVDNPNAREWYLKEARMQTEPLAEKTGRGINRIFEGMLCYGRSARANGT